MSTTEGVTPAPTLKSLVYEEASSDSPRSLRVLDQLRLPHETVYIDIPHVQAAFDVIKKMQIRGMYQHARTMWRTHTTCVRIDAE